MIRATVKLTPPARFQTNRKTVPNLATVYNKLPALVKVLKKKGGVVTFRAGSVNIDLSRAGLKATKWGRRIICDDISSVVFEHGDVTLHNLKYRGMGFLARFVAGAWLRRDRKITFPYSDLMNGKI
ncbi:MAG: hypothetical protein AB7E55_00895, partial [Pigmentiphaga sp.]